MVQTSTYTKDKDPIGPANIGSEASISRSVRVSEQVLAHLQDLVDAEQRTSFGVITLKQGEKLRADDNNLMQDLSGREVVILEGELKVSGASDTVSFGPGYTIFSPADFLTREARDQLIANSATVKLLTIPRHTFSKWLESSNAFRQSVAAAIKDAYPQVRFPDVTRESIRRVRDENMRHVVFKGCIEVVNKQDGIFDIINPNRRGFVQDQSSPRVISPEEQAFQLVEAVSPVFIHVGESKIKELALTSRKTADEIDGLPEFEKVAVAFQNFNALLRRESANQIAQLLPAFSAELERHTKDDFQLDWLDVTRRVLQIKWLEYLTDQAGKSGDLLDRVLASKFGENQGEAGQALRSIKEILDSRLEPLVELLMTQEPERVARLGFRRFDVTVRMGAESAFEDLELTREDREFMLMKELSERLARGDRSAVGGAEYVKRRIPKDLLDAAARGNTQVVFYDGPHRDAIEWARVKFGATKADPNVLRGCLEMEIAGTYGDFSRSWINFKNGESVLVISQDGSPIRNAAALLLYEDSVGRTTPFENIHMVRHRHSLDDRIQEDLNSILHAEEQRLATEPVFGQLLGSAKSLPTFLLILDSPEEFSELMGEHLESVTVPSRVLGKLRIGYWKTPEGEVRRVIMPTVGSRGLYGDSAGTFVKSFFSNSQIERPVKHIFFSASAGSFSGTQDNFEKNGLNLRGLPKNIGSGALVMPERTVTYQEESFPLETILARAEQIEDSRIFSERLADLRARLNFAAVHTTDQHYSIEAPALETRDVIKEVIKAGHATIDVEGGPIAKAIRELDLGITCTSVFISTDDPRQALKDPSKSLAYGGVLLQGKQPQPDLNKLIRSYLLLADLFEQENR